MPNRNIKGTHFQGPILGSSAAVGGLFENLPLSSVDGVRTPYKIFAEHFDVQMADGNLAKAGATLTNQNTATSPTEVIDGASPFLLINPGTKADAGSSVQFNAAVADDLAGAPVKTVGPIVSTATLMDNKELFFQTRVGFAVSATPWDAKALVGWIVTDGSPLATGTGALAISDGGGAGFNVQEDGTLSYFTSAAAITSPTGTVSGVNVITDINALTAGEYKFYTLGVHIRITDASASTGVTDFYVDNTKVATVLDSVPMDSTETYSMTYTMINGASAVNHDMAVDYIISGISRGGLTYDYSSGTW